MNFTALGAILALLAIETVALLKGVNGAGVGLIITAVAALVIYLVHKALVNRRQVKAARENEGVKQP